MHHPWGLTMVGRLTTTYGERMSQDRCLKGYPSPSQECEWRTSKSHHSSNHRAITGDPLTCPPAPLWPTPNLEIHSSNEQRRAQPVHFRTTKMTTCLQLILMPKHKKTRNKKHTQNRSKTRYNLNDDEQGQNATIANKVKSSKEEKERVFLLLSYLRA